ncbi:hypothetical protein BKA57DRAFT_165218 [Linnemannia elongata]|nr:hypothetical protein BKA57DRAFT_165218 [Linnemannia elongata]
MAHTSHKTRKIVYLRILSLLHFFCITQARSLMFLAFSLSLLSVYAVLSESPHQTFTFTFTSLGRLHYRFTTSEQSVNAYTSLLGQERLEVSRNIVLVQCAYVCKVSAFFSPSPSLFPPDNWGCLGKIIYFVLGSSSPPLLDLLIYIFLWTWTIKD